MSPCVAKRIRATPGSAISKFVDAQGGSVWRANFYLRKTGDAQESKVVSKPADYDALVYKQFDNAWLNQAEGKTEFVYPAIDAAPSARAVHVGVKHPNHTRVTLLLNGAKAPTVNFAGRDVNKARTVALSRWRGVSLVDGDNQLTAIIADPNGQEIERVTRTISFVAEASRAELALAQSQLVADGQNPPVIAVKVTDGAGRAVYAGRRLTVNIDPPYRAKDLHLIEDQLPLTAPLSAQSSVAVGSDGLARIELEPTLQTGKARLVLELDGGRKEEFIVFLKPALREWIVIGLAEGTGSLERSTAGGGAPSARELMGDGRIAVFAKGAAKGDWLITAAVDTDKKRGDEDDELYDAVDPDSRYSVFGDRSAQQFEAQSRYPVYLKAEKGGFQAMLGDYDTGLTESRLGKYARRFSGVQTTYEGRRFGFSGFVAETNQEFIRDEIAADGTSGPFRLAAAPLVRNSEVIVVEARDRFRPDVIVSTIPLTRYYDYDIDFDTGELLFRLPIAAANDENSFNVIVAEYETSTPVERNIVAGGRSAVRFAKGKAELGVSFIHEEGRSGAVNAQNHLGAVDLRVDVTDTTKLRLEYGLSRRENEIGEKEDGYAILAEADHVSRNITARAYYNETEAGFGLGQQSSATSGVRRYGGEARFRIDEFNSEKTGALGGRFIEAAAYREENLTSGASRSVAEIAFAQESDHDGPARLVSAAVIEKTGAGLKRRSLLATASVSQTFKDLGLTLRASRDQPIAGEKGSRFFPQAYACWFRSALVQQSDLDG